MRTTTVLLVVSLLPAVTCGQARAPEAESVPQARGEAAMTLTIRSPAFDDGARIPVRYTADGPDLSPPLRISGVPVGTASLALIVDDPDAPVGTWVHWVVWNVPPGAPSFPEGGTPDGAVEGRNSWGRSGWGGPSPPSGTHRYFFKVYALDTVLDLPPTAGKDQLVRAMEGHVLAKAQLMGTYSR